MLGFIRITLIILVAALTGCATSQPRVDSLLEAYAPDRPAAAWANWPLKAEAVYQTPEFAESLYFAFDQWRGLNYTREPHAGLIKTCFTLKVLKAVDTLSGDAYGPYGHNVEVCISLQPPEANKEIVLDIDAPDGLLFCGTFNITTTGILATNQGAFNDQVIRDRRKKGRATLVQRADSIFGRIDPKALMEPGSFSNEIADFLCVTTEKEAHRVPRLIPPSAWMSPRNIQHFANHDPALQEGIERIVKASRAGEPEYAWSTTTRTTLGKEIINCPRSRYLCGEPYRGPVLWYHIRLQDDGSNNGCFRVWVMIVGRYLREMDTNDPRPDRSREVVTQEIDCHHPAAPILQP